MNAPDESAGCRTQGAAQTPSKPVALLCEPCGRAVLGLDPAALARPVGVALALRDDAFETALADDPVERLAVLERRDELHLRPPAYEGFAKILKPVLTKAMNDD